MKFHFHQKTTLTKWFYLVWYGMVWHGLVWFGLVWFGMVWYGLVWFGMVWYGLVWLERTCETSKVYFPKNWTQVRWLSILRTFQGRGGGSRSWPEVDLEQPGPNWTWPGGYDWKQLIFILEKFSGGWVGWTFDYTVSSGPCSWDYDSETSILSLLLTWTNTWTLTKAWPGPEPDLDLDLELDKNYFHHLQLMKNIEGGGASELHLSLQRTQISLI